jgi:diaminopropionate ammonia-lyase
MLGYTRMLDEEAGDEPVADVVFVPAGVGGLLAAIASWGHWRYGDRRPAIVAVEPIAAACVQASMRRGAPTRVEGPLATVMAGLRCGEMSPIAFRAIASLVDAFVAIEDELAIEAMRRLARPAPGDPVVACGASGAAALGGLLAALRAPELGDVRAALRLGPRTRALVLVTEGITDPEMAARVLADP